MIVYLHSIGTKEIIDAHFSENYSYYLRVCEYRFSGRYLKEDLLHEAYMALLKVRPEVVSEFYKAGKLRNLGIRSINHIYGKRGRCKKNNGSSVTSPLFEVRSNGIFEMFTENDVDFRSDTFAHYMDEMPDEGPTEKEIREKENQLTRLQEIMSQALNEIEEINVDPKQPTNYMKVLMFQKVNETSAYDVHKRTGISRAYVDKITEQGRDYLKNELKKTA